MKYSLQDCLKFMNRVDTYINYFPDEKKMEINCEKTYSSMFRFDKYGELGIGHDGHEIIQLVVPCHQNVQMTDNGLNLSYELFYRLKPIAQDCIISYFESSKEENEQSN